MMKGNEFVTKKHFDDKLDKKLKEYSVIVVQAVDGVLEKRLKKTEEKLEGRIDKVNNSIDEYVNDQEEFEQEFVVIKEETRKIKDVIRKKLGVEISAF